MSRRAKPGSFEAEVLPLFEVTRAAWLAEARAVAHRLGEGGRMVTIDDVRAECPPPAEVDPRVCGAVFVRREWARVGFTSSNRRTCHRRPISTFMRREFVHA